MVKIQFRRPSKVLPCGSATWRRAALSSRRVGGEAICGRGAPGLVDRTLTLVWAEDRDDSFIGVDADQVSVTIRLVAEPVPRTAGRPYSRATIAAWHMTPPASVTAAAILAKTGVPARLGERCDEDLAVLDVCELLDVEDHSGRSFNETGRAGDAVQLCPSVDADELEGSGDSIGETPVSA
jgi:hypothetical protein